MFTYVKHERSGDRLIPLEVTVEPRGNSWFSVRVREISNPQGYFRRMAQWSPEPVSEDEGMRTWQLYSAWHAAGAPNEITTDTKPYSIRFYEQPEALAELHGPEAVADMAVRTDNRWFS